MAIVDRLGIDAVGEVVDLAPTSPTSATTLLALIRFNQHERFRNISGSQDEQV